MIFSAHIEALYTELPFAERFISAKKDGFSYVEFWDWDNKDLAEVVKLCEEYDLELSAMSGDKHYDMCNPKDSERYIEQVKKSIDIANKISCKNVVIHSNELTKPGPVLNELNNLTHVTKLCSMFDNLKKLAPYAESKNVTLVVEALNTITDHAGNFLTNTKTSAEIIKAVDSEKVKILYDVYHMFLTEGKLIETVEQYLPYIGYMHFADAPGRHEPGTGVINYKKFFELLQKMGYEGIIGCELFASNETREAIENVKKSIPT